jgi:Domain of unknown function (DUF4824)
MRWYGLPLAAAIVLLVNTVILARVAHNRTGEPDAVVTLSERELPRAWQATSLEDSGVALRFDVSRPFLLTQEDEESADSSTVDAAKLASLGFDVRLPPDPDEYARGHVRQLPRRAFAVLEAGGAHWAAWMARIEGRLASLDAEVASGKQTVEEANRLRQSAAVELRSGSRLFFVDVGLDADALRRQYPDRRAQLILPALVRPHLVRTDWRRPCRPPECRLGGTIELLTSGVNVPKPLQGALLEQAGRTGEVPRYLVDLTVGRGHEPWITGIRPLLAPK